MKNLLTEIIRAVIDKYSRFKKTEYFYKGHRILYDKQTKTYCLKYNIITEYLPKAELEEIIIKESDKHAKM